MSDDGGVHSSTHLKYIWLIMELDVSNSMCRMIYSFTLLTINLNSAPVYWQDFVNHVSMCDLKIVMWKIGRH